jgi:hypothetical protein
MGLDRSPAHVNEALREISDDAKRATKEDAEISLRAEDGMLYFKDDSYTADPSVALGQVFVTRKGSNRARPFLFPVDVTVKPGSLLSAPLVRGELIVDKAASLNVDALSMAGLNLGAKDVAEIHVIDNYSSRADTGAAWRAAIKDWRGLPESKKLIDDPEVVGISVVVGVVQKYLTVKTYTEYSGESKVGAYGVNVEGRLFTSTSSYRLEIVYGFSLVDLQRSATELPSPPESPPVDVAAVKSVRAWARRTPHPLDEMVRVARQ